MSELPPGFRVKATPTESGATPPPGFVIKSPGAAATAPEPTDPRAKAKAYLDAHPEAQPSVLSSLANKAGQGFTFGWGDEIAAGISALRDKVKHGGDIGEHYALEHAMQQELLDRAGKKTGVGGVVAEIAGGVGSGFGLAKNGLTLMKAGQGLLPTVGRGALEGAIYGGLSGSGLAETDKTTSGLKGAAIGGALGGALPVVVEAGKKVLSPITSNLHARMDPKGYAQEQLGKTIERSGKSAQQLTDDLAAASGAGQENYVLADALGESGQKQLSALVKSPGAQKQNAIEVLRARNNGMGRQVSSFIDDAFNTHGNTADEYTKLMEAARDKAGDVRYARSRVGAGPVDLQNTVSTLESLRDPAGVLSGPVTGAQSIAPTPIEEAAKLVGREGLGPTNAADYDAVLYMKGLLDKIKNSAMHQGDKVGAGQVGQVKQAVHEALGNASPGYVHANDTFSRMSRPIEAVEIGQKAAVKGRSKDIANTFNSMGRPAQQGFRVGYADKLISDLGGPNAGNKISDMLVGDIADDIARTATPGKAPLLNEQLQRAKDMITTGNLAMGGSPTMEIAGQQADIGQSLSMLGNLAQGNIGSAIKQGAAGTINNWNGNTEAVRDQLIPMLMSRSGGIDLNSLLQAIQQSAAARQTVGNDIGRGVITGSLPPAFAELFRSNTSPVPANVTSDNLEALRARIPR